LFFFFYELLFFFLYKLSLFFFLYELLLSFFFLYALLSFFLYELLSLFFFFYELSSFFLNALLPSSFFLYALFSFFLYELLFFFLQSLPQKTYVVSTDGHIARRNHAMHGGIELNGRWDALLSQRSAGGCNHVLQFHAAQQAYNTCVLP